MRQPAYSRSSNSLGALVLHRLGDHLFLSSSLFPLHLFPTYVPFPLLLLLLNQELPGELISLVSLSSDSSLSRKARICLLHNIIVPRDAPPHPFFPQHFVYEAKL